MTLPADDISAVTREIDPRNIGRGISSDGMTFTAEITRRGLGRFHQSGLKQVLLWDGVAPGTGKGRMEGDNLLISDPPVTCATFFGLGLKLRAVRIVTGCARLARIVCLGDYL
ncbi:MAG: hypothetical protein NT028_13630, partial [candidate division Zixibacteria bacterium]|nr:hypothetical protein [candidate division Zixibacteria bacterium]